MKMRLLRAAKVREMMEQIDSNLGRYRAGDFDNLGIDLANYIETEHTIDDHMIAMVDCDENDHREVENCKILYEAMNGLSRYLARDERIWGYLVHTELLEYTRKRWPIPADDDSAVQHIRNHFFVIGARGFERDNAASRLWWIASLCNRVKKMTLHEALSCLLYLYDVRANIIERPTTSQNTKIFSAILMKLYESYNEDKGLFERDRFRAVMRDLNLKGGTKLLDALDEKDLAEVVDECFA